MKVVNFANRYVRTHVCTYLKRLNELTEIVLQKRTSKMYGLVSKTYKRVRVYRRTVRFDFSLLHCVVIMLNGVTSNHAVFHTVELLKSE